MNTEELNAKIDVINDMITALGKLTNVQIRLKFADPPQPELVEELDTKRKALRDEIDRLHGQVADEWTMSAAEIQDRLRNANTQLQDKIRAIKNNISVAKNAVKVIGQIDDAMKFIDTIV